MVGYNSATIISSFWAGAVDTDRGIGAANVDENDAVRFGENEWPTEDLNDGWKLAPNGGYWESLGHWDATDPVYPSLAGLPEIPTP